jgi:hypothetical protein
MSTFFRRQVHGIQETGDGVQENLKGKLLLSPVILSPEERFSCIPSPVSCILKE